MVLYSNLSQPVRYAVSKDKFNQLKDRLGQIIMDYSIVEDGQRFEPPVVRDIKEAIQSVSEK